MFLQRVVRDSGSWVYRGCLNLSSSLFSAYLFLLLSIIAIESLPKAPRRAVECPKRITPVIAPGPEATTTKLAVSDDDGHGEAGLANPECDNTPRPERTPNGPDDQSRDSGDGQKPHAQVSIEHEIPQLPSCPPEVPATLEDDHQVDADFLPSTSKYTYRPLPDGYIRLLRLSPHHDDRDGPNLCELFDHSLLDSGTGTRPYETLSYVWGPPGRPSVVHVSDSYSDDHSSYLLPVTENLHNALCRLRDRSLARMIWVDAICINQEDPGERERQVQLMAMIYARSLRVVVWLEDPLSANTTNDKRDDVGEREATDDDSDKAFRALLTAASGVNVASDAARKVVIKWLQRAWFKRVWVSPSFPDIVP